MKVLVTGSVEFCSLAIIRQIKKYTKWIFLNLF